ncbi:aminoacyl-tRNA hydrolase [Candidatus Saccharibacteria bacterium]|nr:aminoacyl-tRNA hydrolase [Candidatus Saccharibacteria bacterium]
MKLIFGLGNPGKQYVGTRHNVGFDTLDSIAIKFVAGFVKKDKFKAEIAEINLAGEKVILARPLTFYNGVGESYRAICDFYKIEQSDTLIVHDELSLPFGTVRVREGGSDAGNNGIKSINQHGGQDSHRVRIGIANADRLLIGDTDFVLGRLKLDEAQLLRRDIMPTIHSLIEQFATGNLSVTSHRHNTEV